MGGAHLHRRRFLRDSWLAAAGAVASASFTSAQAPVFNPETDVNSILRPAVPPAYGVRSRFETAGRIRVMANSMRTPLQDLTGVITPSGLHFVVTHGNPVPDIEPAQHRLMIHGMVERPLVFSLAEIKRLPSVTRVHFLQCAGNSYSTPDMRKNAKTVQDSHGWTSCSEWTGVPLSVLLNEAGVDKKATWLVAEGTEWKKHAASIPLQRALNDGLLVYAQNGEALRPEQGYPLRLVVPGIEGQRNVKWLRRLKLVDRPTYNQWEMVTYTMLGRDGKARWFDWEIEPNSVITFPSGGAQLAGRGFYEISGLAWSGGGFVRRVEVSTDGGRIWSEAKLQEPVHRFAHTRFRFAWNWNGREAVIQSRCIDEWGHVQPTKGELEKALGVGPDYWLTTTNVIPHFQASQPWRVAADGAVHNAMFA